MADTVEKLTNLDAQAVSSLRNVLCLSCGPKMYPGETRTAFYNRLAAEYHTKPDVIRSVFEG